MRVKELLADDCEGWQLFIAQDLTFSYYRKKVSKYEISIWLEMDDYVTSYPAYKIYTIEIRKGNKFLDAATAKSVKVAKQRAEKLLAKYSKYE